MLYVVCTNCTFLRAYSRRAVGASAPADCPACGSELEVWRGAGRFPSAYVSKVSLELLATSELQPDHRERAG
jgi:hypothetical protein